MLKILFYRIEKEFIDVFILLEATLILFKYYLNYVFKVTKYFKLKEIFYSVNG